MSKIFFSYRRIDSEATTKRVYRQFARAFGFWHWLGAEKQNLFLDKDSLLPKGDFRAQIQRFIIQSDHMLVFIGKDWLAEIQRRKAAGEVDFVLIEIESAFIHQVNVIPVLVHGASMPNRAVLPDEIKQLAMQQAYTIRDAYFEEDVARLIAQLKPARFHWIATVAAVTLLSAFIALIPSFAQEARIANETATSAAIAQVASLHATEAALVTTIPSVDVPTITPKPSETATPTITYTPSITPLSAEDIHGTSQAEVFSTLTQEAVAATSEAERQETLEAEIFATITQNALNATETQAYILSLTPFVYTATPTDRPTRTQQASSSPTRTEAPVSNTSGYPCPATVRDSAASSLNIVRAQPDDSAVLVRPVFPNEEVEILDNESSNGIRWYQIRYRNYVGWVQQDDVNLSNSCP